MQPNCYAEAQMSMAVHLTLLGHVLRKRSDYIKPGFSVCNGKGIAVWLLEETNQNLPGNPHKTNQKGKNNPNQTPEKIKIKTEKGWTTLKWRNSVKTIEDKSTNTSPAQLGCLAAKYWCYCTSVIQDVLTCTSSDRLISLPVSKGAFVNHTLSSCPQLKKPTHI